MTNDLFILNSLQSVDEALSWGIDLANQSLHWGLKLGQEVGEELVTTWELAKSLDVRLRQDLTAHKTDLDGWFLFVLDEVGQSFGSDDGVFVSDDDGGWTLESIFDLFG